MKRLQLFQGDMVSQKLQNLQSLKDQMYKPIIELLLLGVEMVKQLLLQGVGGLRSSLVTVAEGMVGSVSVMTPFMLEQHPHSLLITPELLPQEECHKGVRTRPRYIPMSQVQVL